MYVMDIYDFGIGLIFGMYALLLVALFTAGMISYWVGGLVGMISLIILMRWLL